MSLWDNIKDFGSSVYSGIGSVFSSPDPTFVGPTAPTGGSLTSTISSGLNNIIDSVFSSFASSIYEPKTTLQSPSTAPDRYITFMPSGSSKQILGMSTIGIVVVAGVVGYLYLTRKGH